MRHDSRVTPQAPPALRSMLAEYLERTGNKLSFYQALEERIRGRIEAGQARRPDKPVPP
jgi:hypothetical protein